MNTWLSIVAEHSTSRFRVALLACIVSLAGAHGAHAETSNAQATTAPAASVGKATVIISVTHDEDTGNKAWTSFYLDSKMPGGLLGRHVLSSIDTVMGIPRGSDFNDLYGKVYILEMTPGPHQIDGWHTSFPMGHIAPVSDPPPLHFELSEGETVYLGNLNMVNRLERPSFISPWTPVGGTPEVRDRQQIDLPIAEAKTPALKGNVQVRLLPLGTWGPQDPPTQTRRWAPPIVITR